MKKSYKKELAGFGAGIKALREKHGMTQQKLSDLCEVDIRMVQRIEKGEENISLSNLFALAEAFDMSLPELAKKAQGF